MPRAQIALLLALALVGCAKKSLPTPTSIVGTWAQIDDGSVLRSTKYYVFRKDGGFESTGHLDALATPPFGGDLKSTDIITTGTYRLEGDKVVVVLNGMHMKINGVEQPMPDPNALMNLPADQKTQTYKVQMVGDSIVFESKGKGDHRYRRITSIPAQ